MENELIKVLYIDDEKPALFNFEQLFHDDFEVYTAPSATQGMEILTKSDIQIIVCDQRMPGKTGVEFFAEVAQLYPDTVRILLTAYSEAEVIIDAINKGQIYQYITKPFDSKNLKNILDKASQNWLLKRENLVLIAEQKEKNEILAQSEEKFRNIFENSIVGISITSIDGNLQVNDAFCHILGYTIDEFVHVNWRDITYKDDIEPNEKYTKSILEGNQNSMRWEKRYLHKKGHIVWVDINTSIVRDENGKPLYFITAIVDITDSKKAEESIKQSEEELRNLIELSPVAMSIIHEWKTVYFNPAAIKLFGAKSQEELINKHIYNFIHQDYKELALENSKILAKSGYIPIHEEKYIKLDGTVLDVETQAKSIRYNDEPATLIVMNDITERKLNEYKTQLNAKRLNALVDVLQYSTDSIQDYLDYALTKIIEITESKIGYIYHYYEDRKEFVLNTWSKEVMNECKVQNQQTVYQLEKTGLWGEAVRQRKPIMVNNFQEAHPLKKGYPEGHAPLYKYLSLPIFYNNQIVGVVAVANKKTDYVEEDIIQLSILMDIVWKALERKIAEDTLKKNQKLLSDTEKIGNVGGWEFNIDTQLQVWTEQTYLIHELPFTFEPNVEKGINFYTPESIPIIVEAVRKAVELGEPFDVELEIITAKGNRRHVHSIGQADLENRRVYGFFQDITERKIAEETIKEKNKELENLIYVASHDLRSPLVNIQGFSQRLENQTSEIVKLTQQAQLETEIQNTIDKISMLEIPKSLGYIKSNITKMDSLINGLLKLSRTGRILMNISEINMSTLFQSIINTHQFELSELDAKVEIDSLTNCYGDENQLNQLFSNIITNAIKYRDTNKQLTLRIHSKTHSNKVVYAITDNGIGINNKYLPKIWDIFYRVNPTKTETGEGLGLSVARKIAEKHKGKVWVESEVGVGSTFYVELLQNRFEE